MGYELFVYKEQLVLNKISSGGIVLELPLQLRLFLLRSFSLTLAGGGEMRRKGPPQDEFKLFRVVEKLSRKYLKIERLFYFVLIFILCYFPIKTNLFCLRFLSLFFI